MASGVPLQLVPKIHGDKTSPVPHICTLVQQHVEANDHHDARSSPVQRLPKGCHIWVEGKRRNVSGSENGK